MLSTVVPVFSTAVGFAGLVAALSGAWSDREGPRKSVALAGVLWGGGLALGGLGVMTNQLPLVYFGYGVVGGTGIGFAYGPPVATLIKWFPDRKGLASGMAIMGFGTGAMVALPGIKYVMEKNFVAPKYLGHADQVLTMVHDNGTRFLQSDPTCQVVVATAHDIAKLGLSPALSSTLDAGVYVVGTGNTGAGAALMALGGVYAIAMGLSSLAYKIPPENWHPVGYNPAVAARAPAVTLPIDLTSFPPDTRTLPTVASAAHTLSSKASVKNIQEEAYAKKSNDIIIPEGFYVPAKDAVKTIQFAQVWGGLFLNATAGIAVLGVAKTLISDVFGSAYPTIVDAQFCAAYVAALSLFNGIGRLGWAAASDKLGRKTTYNIFLGLGMPLFINVALCAHLVGTHDNTNAPLIMFVASTLSIISMYGGGFSVAPAYLADLFGSKDVGNIYGKLLTAWAAAGVVGPTLLANRRRSSEIDAIQTLAMDVKDKAEFQITFGAPIEHLQTLINSNSVTIDKLLPLCPPGTVDPTPFLYDTTMFTLATFLGLAFMSNALVRPVSKEFLKRVDGVK